VGGKGAVALLDFHTRSFFVVPPWKRLNNAIFRYFLIIFGIFSVASLPPGKFFADALG